MSVASADECFVILCYLDWRGPSGPTWNDLEEERREVWRRLWRLPPHDEHEARDDSQHDQHRQ